MILRKMRNNAVKPIPKDFANGLALSMYNNSMQAEETGVNPIDAEFREVPEMVALPSTATSQRGASGTKPIPEEAVTSVQTVQRAEAPEKSTTVPF